MKYIRNFNTVTEATSANDLVSPNLTMINSDNGNKLLALDSGTKDSKLQIKLDDSGEPIIEEKSGMPEGFVDLGLSVYWAKWDLGATAEGEYGKYYAWGDTTGYVESEVSGKFTEEWYNTLPAASITTDLSGDNDAATVALGSPYRMPTKAEFEELIDLTKTVETVGGHQGMRFTASNGNSIFIPFAGGAYEGNIILGGDDALAWSLTFEDLNYAWNLDCDNNGNISINDFIGRCCGSSVRPVCPKS